jgi:hypothetical protein
MRAGSDHWRKQNRSLRRGEENTMRLVHTGPMGSGRPTKSFVNSRLDRNPDTDVLDKCFVRVDVTDGFPFLVTKVAQYYDK